MLRIITAEEKEKWNQIVKSYENWDIYYLCEYAEMFRVHGDGKPMLIDFKDGEDRLCYVVMLQDIAEDKRFKGNLEAGRFFDCETPYGYGGPLIDKPLSDRGKETFRAELIKYARMRGIVSQFVRFHPLLANHEALPDLFQTRYLHKTIYIDTASPELIMANMDSKNRNMVRKAMKNDVTIVRREIEEYQDFIPIYEETMDKDNASEYYYFNEDYFREQIKLKENACFFYAMKSGSPIAAAIMYYNDRFMHYHLAGTHTEYRKYSPSNLLLYEAACWASERGIKRFHLGGGIVEDDNLFGFKKQFNKNDRLSFYIGRTIFDDDVYRKLLSVRKENDENFNVDNNRMIQYRA